MLRAAGLVASVVLLFGCTGVQSGSEREICSSARAFDARAQSAGSNEEFARAVDGFETALFQHRGETFEIAALGRDAVRSAQEFAYALEDGRDTQTLARRSVDSLIRLLRVCQAAGR